MELIDVLIRELGNQVDARDNYQFTPLHSAANGGHVAAIRRLADLKHDLDTRDYLGAWACCRYAAAVAAGCCKLLSQAARSHARLEQSNTFGPPSVVHQWRECCRRGTTSRALCPPELPAGYSPACPLCPPSPSLALSPPAPLSAPACHCRPHATPLCLHARPAGCPGGASAAGSRHGAERSEGRFYGCAQRLGLGPCRDVQLSSWTAVLQRAVGRLWRAGLHSAERGCLLPAPLQRPGLPALLPDHAALHLAADAGQCDSVSRLVALGAPVDAASNKGHTPLSLALLKVRRRLGWTI